MKVFCQQCGRRVRFETKRRKGKFKQDCQHDLCRQCWRSLNQSPRLRQLQRQIIKELYIMSTQVVVPDTNPILPITSTPIGKRPNLFDKALVLSVSKNSIGLTKTVHSSRVQVNAQTDAYLVQKKLFFNDELKAIFSHDVKLDDWIKLKASPFPLKMGLYLMPVDFFAEVESRLVEHKNKRVALVEEFITSYEGAIIKAQEKLGELFNAGDYPPPDAVRRQFDFKWNYLDFSISEKLREISKETFERKQQELEGVWLEAQSVASGLLATRMKALVDWMMDRLTPETNEEGEQKKKIFKKNSLDRFQKFFDEFPVQVAILGESQSADELKKMVEQAKALMDGIGPEALRSNEETRKVIQTGFQEIQKTLDTLVVEAPDRSIRIED